MAYNKPPANNIPFNFTPGGYQAPNFGNIVASFNTRTSQTAHLGAAIQGMLPNYQSYTYTYLKYCERYVVGYSRYGVQIMKGKCYYGGIRDIGATLIGEARHRDLPAYLNPQGFGLDDLNGYIKGLISGESDLPASIESESFKNLGGIIGAHPPVDLQAIIGAHAPEDLPGYIRGFASRDLPASLNVVYSRNLPAEIGGHLPEDLGGYIKPWPQRDLPGFIHSWQEADLSAYINMIAREDLPAIIAGHRPRDIKAWIKGWVREATYDLGGSLHGFITEDLGADIRGTFMEQLPAYLFPIQPRDISAFIHGWQEANLGATIDGDDYPWNLPASINITGGYDGLPAEITGKHSVALPTDLRAYILVTQGVTNLPAAMVVKQARDLGAFIDPGKDIGDLSAEIYPKRIRLTGILDVITMEHSDLSATISIPCFYSNLKDLSAYIRPVHQANLGASIYPKDYAWATGNLSASFGYSANTMVQDRLAINIAIKPLGYRTEDKFTINFEVFRGGLSLGASISAHRPPANLPAYINALDVLPYFFDDWKGSERVYDTNYTQELKDYEDVNILFQTIVTDYFYSSGSDVVAKVDRYSHFVTKVASYYSPATSRKLNRKLHKVKYLYDMRRFEDIDEAVRYAIWYVTTTHTSEMGALINGIAPRGNQDISAYIGAKRYYSDDNNLTSLINGKATHDYDVVIGYTDDGVGYLEF